ncbi:hypothetical protein AAFF_G00079080 [Aldrovandia affinis]|uniref:Uncharacterized protein n=1 Tax=Aldrovandia affinis TaxID=143900 RepID=A0AAD7RXF9_9TELE|nr:hypothetical protein AAFF_G00079080 [Aldrovandia affinis]
MPPPLPCCRSERLPLTAREGQPLVPRHVRLLHGKRIRRASRGPARSDRARAPQSAVKLHKERAINHGRPRSLQASLRTAEEAETYGEGKPSVMNALSSAPFKMQFISGWTSAAGRTLCGGNCLSARSHPQPRVQN